MKKFLGLVFVVFLFFLAYLSNVSTSESAGVCSGNFYCEGVYTVCTFPSTGQSCESWEYGCNCQSACDGSQGPANSCAGAAQSFCTTGSSYVCTEFCGLRSWACGWTPDACTSGGQCGSGYCCAGSPNYCSNSCYDCAGNYTCAAPTSVPPTPTPATGCAATWFGTQASCDSWCIGQGHDGCNAGCNGCWDGAAPTPTPVGATPTTPPAPTSPPACGPCGCGNIQCLPLAACWSSCCTCTGPSTADCSACGTPCTPNGIAEGAGGCCSGYSSGGVCANPPTCTGCQFWNGSYCQDNNSACGGGQVCNGGTCVDPTYSIQGSVFVDTNGSGTQNCSGACDNGAGDEPFYTGAISVSRFPAQGNNNSYSTSANGSTYTVYRYVNLPAFVYTMTLNPISGYQITTTNPRSVTVGPNQTSRNFGIQAVATPPTCTAVTKTNSGDITSGNTVGLSVIGCTNVENPNNGVPPPPFNWNPNPVGVVPAPSSSGQSDSLGPISTSTINFTAPTCPPGDQTYNPQVTVSGSGGSSNYSTSVVVPGTHNIQVTVLSVTDTTTCPPSTGTSTPVATVPIDVNPNPIGSGGTNPASQTTVSTGTTTFTCVTGSGNKYDYVVNIIPPAGSVVTGGSLPTTGNTMTVNDFATNANVTFCIQPLNAWFQTDKGDVRFGGLSNPVPAGQIGSLGENTSTPNSSLYPGIFYSSNSNANMGVGTASSKNWVINKEYDYNADTANRSGGMSYDFFVSKARQDGVSKRTMTSGNINWGFIDPTSPSKLNGGGSGVYEVVGDLTINSSPPSSIFNSTNKSRVVILVKGNVTISAPINIPVSQGVLIVAAHDDLNVTSTVGTPNPINTSTLSQTGTHLDGYYTAQGNISIDGTNCASWSSPDRRLNVGGALIAHSLKPFAKNGSGAIDNNRSLCADNSNYPSLYVVTRTDFLTQLTDFYKTSYTKWQEINP